MRYFLVQVRAHSASDEKRSLLPVQSNAHQGKWNTSLVKALTVRQPWAWAIVMGYKDVENRARRTNHRGQVLIHAAKQMDPAGFQVLWELGVYRHLPDKLPLGGLVGLVEIVDCVTNAESPWAQSRAWHWMLRRPKEFKTPLPCNGSLGFFDPDVSSHALGQTVRHAIAHKRRIL